MTRLATAAAIVAVMPLLAGCGSSGQTTIAARTSAVTRPSLPVAIRTTPTTSTTTPPTPPPGFVLRAKTQDGDKVTVEGRFGPALPPAQSDADQAAVGACPQSDGRELIARLDLTITVQSSLAARVVLDEFRTDVLADGITEFLMGYAEGPSCESVDGADHRVEFATIQPHVSQHFTVWVILDDAITPNNPHPSARKLGLGWRMGIPTVTINNTPARDTAIGGPQVINCSQPYSGQDEFIFIAGTAPHVIRGLKSPEQLPCTREPIR